MVAARRIDSVLVVGPGGLTGGDGGGARCDEQVKGCWRCW